MMIFYSQSTGGFYSSAIHGTDIPNDAVEISAEDHAALLQAQSEGKAIEPDANGRPIAADRPALTPEQLATRVRAERDARLTACDWTQLPDAPLTADAKTAWGAYRQALRDVPEQAGFPLNVEWPVVPE